MKRMLLPLMLAVVVATPALAQKKSTPSKPQTPPPAAQESPYKSLPIGASIPNPGGVMMSTTPGQLITLGQAKTEKGLVVMFSCNTCPFVIKSQQRTKEAIALAKSLGLGFVVINSNEAQRSNEDSPEAMLRYARQQDYAAPYLRDDGSMMANLFGATRTPEVFLFDGEGKLVYKGAMEDEPANPHMSRHLYLKDAMEALIANKPITITETKSIGCSIKRMN